MHRGLFMYHPVVGHTYIPGLRARVEHEAGGYLVRVNQHGFRSERDFERGSRSGIRRILLFGDSFTAGDGVDNGERYSDLLEVLLPDLEVYNLAVAGTGTDQQYLVYREFGRAFAHDLVVIGVFLENIRRNTERFHVWGGAFGQTVLIAKPYVALNPDGSLTLGHVPVPKGPRAPEGDTGDGRVLDWVSSLPAYERTADPGWLLMRAILTTWAAESPAPVLIVPIPLPEQIDGDLPAAPYQARFAELARVPGVTVHDPLPDLLALPPAERRALRFARDPHLGPAGHRALAGSLVRPLRAMLTTGG